MRFRCCLVWPSRRSGTGARAKPCATRAARKHSSSSASPSHCPSSCRPTPNKVLGELETLVESFLYEHAKNANDVEIKIEHRMRDIFAMFLTLMALLFWGNETLFSGELR